MSVSDLLPFPVMEKKVHAIFMKDREDSYSMRSWQKLMSGVPLPDRVNAGWSSFVARPMTSIFWNGSWGGAFIAGSRT